MRSTTTSILAAALGLWLARPAGSLELCALSELATVYEAGVTLRVEVRLGAGIQDVDIWQQPEGGPETRQEGGSRRSSRETRQVVRLDRTLEVEHGRPVRQSRRFVEAGGTSVSRFGAAENANDLASPLEGRELELSIGRDGEPRAKLVLGAGQESAEPVSFPGQRPGLELDALLPGDDVTPGDTWKLGDAALRGVLGLEADLELFPCNPVLAAAADPAKPNIVLLGGVPLRLPAWPRWSGTATLLSEEESWHGEHCRVIRVEAQGSAKSGDGEPARGQAQGRLVGRVLFSLESHRPVRATFEGEIDLDRSLPGPNPDEPQDRIRVVSECRFEQIVEVSVEPPSGSEGH